MEIRPHTHARKTFAAVMLIGTLLVGGLVTPSPARDQDPDQERAGAFVTQIIFQAMTISGDQQLDQRARQQRYTQLFKQNLDVRRVSQFVVGRHWATASDREREEFEEIYPAYLGQALANRLGQFSGATVTVVGTRRLNDEIQVTTKIYFVGPRPADATTSQWEIRWLVGVTRDGFKIEDIDFEGASLELSQRTDLMSLIERGAGTLAGLTHLIRALLGGEAIN